MKKILAALSAAALCLSLTACATSSTQTETPAPSGGSAGVSGTFSAEAAGQGGASNPVKVTITLEDSKITDVKAEGPGETEGIGSKAIEALPPQIVSTGSIQVDAVTGATVTSNAIMTAAAAALESAGLNPEDYRLETASVPAVAEERSWPVSQGQVPSSLNCKGSVLSPDFGHVQMVSSLPAREL